MAVAHFDIIVVGGGPAGSSAALRAVQAGARVLLLERRAMPRPKLCGGWISLHALSLLGFALPEAVVETPFARAQLHFHDTGQTYAPPGTFGVFVDRGRFDEYLLERASEAGADCEFEAVSRIDHGAPHYTVQTPTRTYHADAVICAAGANSRLCHALRPPDRSNEWAIAVEQAIPVQYADRWGLMPGDAYLHFGAVSFGYAWALHHGAYLLVGVGARRDKVTDVRALHSELWREWRLPQELFACQGHPIPLGGHDRVVGKARFLTVGDAAGMVDAFNGEGIAGAIRSGQLAANCLVSQSGGDAANLYSKSVDRELGGEMRMSRRTSQLFHSLPESLIRAFCVQPEIAENYDAVLQRKATYGSFLRWLLRRRLWHRTAVSHESVV